MMELQFISHGTSPEEYIQSIQTALDGGCRWIQLRMKDTDDTTFTATAAKVRRLCDTYGAVMIIDDRVHLVETTEADGVHLGKLDMPVEQARKILGNEKIIGGTANTFDDIRMHFRAGADYIGCGPFRFTTTKKNLSPVLGLDGYRQIVGKMKEEGVDIPVVAIGGIKYKDIDGILSTGINGIAISGGVLNAADPVNEMRRISKLVSDTLEAKHSLSLKTKSK